MKARSIEWVASHKLLSFYALLVKLTDGTQHNFRHRRVDESVAAHSE
jgi:hypothetical protein